MIIDQMSPEFMRIITINAYVILLFNPKNDHLFIKISIKVCQ